MWTAGGPRLFDLMTTTAATVILMLLLMKNNILQSFLKVV